MAIQRIQDFLMAIRSANDDASLTALCTSELAYLRSAYDVQESPDEFGRFKGLPTYKREVTKYRGALYPVNRRAWELFKISKQDSANLTYQDGKSAMRNYVNRAKGEVHIINSPDQYIQLAKDLLKAVSYIDNILGLAALTGRRVNEVGHSSEFDYCDYDDMIEEYHRFEGLLDFEQLDFITVYGLSKKQTYLNDKRGKDYGIIPILTNPELIFDALSELRKLKTFTSADDFHNKASKDISIKVKKRFGDFLGDRCTGHDLRKAYARLTFECLKKGTVYQDDGLLPFAELVLKQQLPDNYMKFASTN